MNKSMSQFINPLFLLKVARSYLFDINRIWKFDEKKLKAYQDKAFRNIVSYAYNNIPLYHETYKAAGIHPKDITGVQDIQTLPFITKDDLRNNYPKGIIPKNFIEHQGYALSTSGSTGKPVFVYYDSFSAVKSLEGYVRILKAYGGSWTKSRIMLIIDLEPGSIENIMFSSSIAPFLKKFLPMNNIRYVHIGDKPEDIIKKINEFQPEFLGSDPNMLRKLSYLKLNEDTTKTTITGIFSGGSMLDDYTRTYIEKAFDSTVYNLYGCTEAGALAFECIEKKVHHVHSDLVYLEFLDKNKKPVQYNTLGSLIVTKLYGTGTPIIRYTGIEDYVTPVDQKTHCGITTQMIGTIEGRKADMIYLPNGKMLSPLTITGIPAKTMEKFNSYKIKQFQIIQHDLHHLEILLVIDEKLRNKDVHVEKMMKSIQQSYQEKLGNDVQITITETGSIQPDARSDYIKVVISKVKQA